MARRRELTAFLALAMVLGSAMPGQAAEASWIDPRTGHRIVRLSEESGLYSLYFHQNGFAASGDGVVLYDSHNVDLLDLRTGARRRLYHWDDPAERAVSLVVAPRSDQLYLLAGGAIRRIDLRSFATQRIAVLPPEWAMISSLAVNANGTLLAGNHTEGVQSMEASLPRSQWITAAEQRHLPSLLFTIRTDTGAATVIHRDDHWLDHPQFSPTDPDLLTFNRQIPPVEEQDTAFLMRADGTALRPVLRRTEHGETIIHSFFGPSGRDVWYDLQSPWGRRFFIGASAVDGGGSLRYPVDPGHWCFHYNLSPDETMIAGDGNPQFPDGKWITLFRRQGDRLAAERLVDLGRQDYALEPNVQFTPDGKWILFRGNFEGAPHPYLVEVAASGRRN